MIYPHNPFCKIFELEVWTKHKHTYKNVIAQIVDQLPKIILTKLQFHSPIFNWVCFGSLF